MLKAVKVKVPKRLKREIQNQIMMGMEEFSSLVLKDFRASVKDWDTKVIFKRDISLNKSRFTAKTYTTNKIYGYVSGGTKAHVVGPRRKGFLAWKSGYNKKTTPGRIPSRAGGAYGRWIFSTKPHRVSGIPARKYPKEIKKKRRKEFKQIMSRRLK